MQGDADVVAAGGIGKAGRIVEQYFILAHLDHQRRQTAEVREKRRDKGVVQRFLGKPLNNLPARSSCLTGSARAG